MLDEQPLRFWLLDLVKETMDREEASDASHDYDHIVRVMALADTIQQREGGNLPILWAAVALHDIGQERERRDGGDHALIGADMAAELLTNTSFPQEDIPLVQEAIREHRMTGGIVPRTVEGRILYDADKIDCLGATGIGRLYCITGLYRQKIYSELPAHVVEPVNPIEVRALRRSSDYSPSIEFQLLYGNLPERMTTHTGRVLAQERYDYMANFFDRLRKEILGGL